MKCLTNVFILISTFLLISCGGGGGGGGGSATISAFELMDPAAAEGNQFGEIVVVLPNGNIVVTSPGDDSLAEDGGAVYLFNPETQTVIASFLGDNEGDELGSDGITALSNNNFVITSSEDTVSGVANAGSVMLINGSNGNSIATITGDDPNDRLGVGVITVLANNNVVIGSPFDDISGIMDAGSVRLMNGSTGEQIGDSIVGDDAGDEFGDFGSITTLSTSRFIISAQLDDVGVISNAGSVRLIDGTTGVQIGSPITGNNTDDLFGRRTIALSNDNFVIASDRDDVAGMNNAGSVRLIDGDTGIQIGATIEGDQANDGLGRNLVALANNRFVIASPSDNRGGVTVSNGSVKLIDGDTGTQIGSTIFGGEDDGLSNNGITVLPNNNFVIKSQGADIGGVTDAGHSMLVNGSTGAIITLFEGSNTGDFFGQSDVIALPNNNFVIVAPWADVGGIIDAGFVMLIDGTTGMQIGDTIAGDDNDDELGANFFTTTVSLPNNNFVIGSGFDDIDGIVDAGSVMLIDGITGAQIGTTISGDNIDDRISDNYDIPVLSNGNFVVVSEKDDIGGVMDAGSIMLINGATGLPIKDTISGIATEDFDSVEIIDSASLGGFIIAAPRADTNGVDSGMVRFELNE